MKLIPIFPFFKFTHTFVIFLSRNASLRGYPGNKDIQPKRARRFKHFLSNIDRLGSFYRGTEVPVQEVECHPLLASLSFCQCLPSPLLIRPHQTPSVGHPSQTCLSISSRDLILLPYCFTST